MSEMIDRVQAAMLAEATRFQLSKRRGIWQAEMWPAKTAEIRTDTKLRYLQLGEDEAAANEAFAQIVQRAVARAAIVAMREPTAWMIADGCAGIADAGDGTWDANDEHDLKGRYQTMIDVALKEDRAATEAAAL